MIVILKRFTLRSILKDYKKTKESCLQFGRIIFIRLVPYVHSIPKSKQNVHFI